MNGNWNKRYVDNSIPSNNEFKESKYENPPNTATDSFFKAYEARDIEKQSQTKRKYGNTSNSINEQPNKRRCKAKKFEAIQYSLGPNEEYIAIRSYEYDIWERREKVKAITTMGKESIKEPVPHDLPPTPFLGHLKEQMGSRYRTRETVRMIGNPE
ncbi:hypothetical protein Tco_1508137 [Tanacetum coccineum]